MSGPDLPRDGTSPEPPRSTTAFPIDGPSAGTGTLASTGPALRVATPAGPAPAQTPTPVPIAGNSAPGYPAPASITPEYSAPASITPEYSAPASITAGHPAPASIGADFSAPASIRPEVSASAPGEAHPAPWPYQVRPEYAPPAAYPAPLTYVQVPSPRRRRSGLRWLVGIVALLTVFVVALAGGLAATLVVGAPGSAAGWHTGDGRVTPSAPLTPTAAPPAGASAEQWSAWASLAAREAISAQGKALIDGDQAGYVGLADPANSKLVTTLTNRFTTLRAMGVGVWTQAVSGRLEVTGTRTWKAPVQIKYCFGGTLCSLAQIQETTTWRVSGTRLVLGGLTAADADEGGPRPFELDALAVKTGSRVVVAASKSLAGRLSQAVAVADKAASIADSFAKWGPAPSRYVIFFASSTDWGRWYGGGEPAWVAASSIPVAASVTEIVVRSDVVSSSYLTVLLTHEMTHVTTMAGRRNGVGRSSWWLIEGIAEYASHLGTRFVDYDAARSTRLFVRSGWNGDVAVTPPGDRATQREAGGKYGVAFLAVRRIAEKYGEAKMLDFWGRVVHDGQSVDDAAKGALGVAWTKVKADCATYVRGQVAAV